MELPAFFEIYPNMDKKNEKAPDYRVCAKQESGYGEIAACWKKVKDGKTYLSCSPSKPKPNYAEGEVAQDEIPF